MRSGGTQPRSVSGLRGAKPATFVHTASYRREAVVFEALLERGAEMRQLPLLGYAVSVEHRGDAIELYRPCIVAPRLHRGHELSQQLLPLPLLKGFYAFQDLRLEPFHVDVHLQGFFGRRHLELCDPEVTLEELNDALEPLAYPS